MGRKEEIVFSIPPILPVQPILPSEEFV